MRNFSAHHGYTAQFLTLHFPFSFSLRIGCGVLYWHLQSGRYLSTQNDVGVLVRGMKHLIRVAQIEPFASLLDREAAPFDLALHGLSDAELEGVVRQRVETLYHPVSTCRMAKLEEGGVVDPFLRVYGIHNLRVADASIFPTIPSGHTVRIVSLFSFYTISYADGTCFMFDRAPPRSPLEKRRRI